MVNPSRIIKHLASTHWRVRRAFSSRAMAEIAATIRNCESRHRGEIRFVVEGSLDLSALWRDQSARERALEVFSLLRVWDTEHNNGILIYLLFADRDVEIIADRGIHRRVDGPEWEHICRGMEESFRRGEFARGVIEGIQAVSRHLIRHFPVAGENPNELSDRPVIL